MLASLALGLTLLLLIFRRVGRYEIPIWASMALGAILVLAGGAISPANAISSVDFDVLLFLAGLFSIAYSLEASGMLEEAAYNLFGRVDSPSQFLLLVLLSTGFLSALLMNDALAIVGTPLVILAARRLSLPAKPFLFALMFAVTIGSVFSPIGNPQNLLIALASKMPSPFFTFGAYLLLPTLLNLILAFLVIRFFFPNATKAHSGSSRSGFRPSSGPDPPGFKPICMVRDRSLARLAGFSTLLLLLLILLRAAVDLLGFASVLPLALLSFIAALPLLFSPRRWEIMRRLDWGTLLLFASMFILMRAVWDEGVFQSLVSSLHLDVTNLPVILLLSAIVSQLMSNVPFTALYLPLLSSAGAGTVAYLALAAGTTLAGNLTPIGAASNLIVIAAAERRGERLDFFEFVKVGAVLTALNLLVIWLFLRMG